MVNHLVGSAELEQFTLGLAATMASKSPLAIAVTKEQLRVLMDYQPIAAPVYERVQGLRREAYDSSDYLEGSEGLRREAPADLPGHLTPPDPERLRTPARTKRFALLTGPAAGRPARRS